jgi:peptide/nickel transport system substrate-binding protein
VAAMQGKPVSGYARLNVNGSERGNNELAGMLHSGLTASDPNGQIHAKLAEDVPTLENGLWKLLPDGRMETTLRIRAGAEWHDGTPLTSDDLVFTFRVVNDRELPIFRNQAYNLVEAVEAPDPQTVVVRWKEPFIRADNMFNESLGMNETLALPLPKHLLETPYQQDKLNFTQLPYFTDEFVGLGPYRLKEWVPGTSVIVQANDRFVLGRPKIDEIEIRTIPDANAIVANLLAGSIDVIIGRALSLDHVVQLRDMKPDLLIETPLTSMLVVNPQLLYDANPPVIRDLSFRRAMMYAIDRQEMVDTIEHGLTPVANGLVYPTLVEGNESERAAARYEYDPRRTAQLVEGLGYTKGADGFYRDAAGQQLRTEIRATQSEINPKTMSAVAEYLQRVGIGIDQVIIPVQLVNDQQYRATFPGLIVNGGGGAAGELENFHSSKVRMAETNYAGSNRAGYRNPQLDSLIDRYLTTIPMEPRMELAREITQHVTENLPQLPLFFDSWPGAASSRLVNARAASDGAQTWNVREWDVR